MAIAATNLTNDASTTDGISFTTASVSYTAGCGYLLSVACFNSASTQPFTSVITGGPSSGWSLLGYLDFDTVPANQGTLFVFWGYASSSTSNTTTVQFYTTMHSFAWSIDEFSGVDSTTPFPQYVTRSDNTTPETTGTLGTMASSSSRSFVALAKNSSVASIYTMDTNWALLSEASVGSPTLHQTTCWSDADGAATSASFTQTTGSMTAGNIIVEVAAATATNVTVTALPGAFSFAGTGPLVSATGSPNITPSAGQFSFSGTAPAVEGNIDVTIVVDLSNGPWEVDGSWTLDDPRLLMDYLVRDADSLFTFSVPAPVIDGTIETPPDGGGGGGEGGPSLARRTPFWWGYKHVGTEKSLAPRKR